MTGEGGPAKQTMTVAVRLGLLRASALSAQAGIWLQLVDDRYEIVEPDNPFELEPCSRIASPDDIGLDTADDRQADDDPVAAIQSLRVIDHEPVGRQVADMQVQIAMHEMLDDSREIDRVTRRAPQIGNA